MNLLQVREQFVKISGRYDLVDDTTDYGDKGANFYIQQGQNYLDRRINLDKTWGRIFVDIAADDFKVEFQSCRAIKEVWVMDSTSRLRLDQIPMEELRGTDEKTGVNNFVKPFASMTTDKPKYYYPAKLRRMPEGGDFSGDSATIASYLDTKTTYDSTYNGIVFLPPADAAYVIEIIGRFYSKTLSLDADVNVWSEVYPNLLIMSALRQLETMFRGAKSVDAWTKSIDAEIVDVEKDLIEEEINQVNQMDG